MGLDRPDRGLVESGRSPAVFGAAGDRFGDRESARRGSVGVVVGSGLGAGWGQGAGVDLGGEGGDGDLV